MSQSQDLPPHNTAQELPTHLQVTGQYQAPVPQQLNQQFYHPLPPAPQPPVPEYVPIPSQTPAPHPPPQSYMPPEQRYVTPDQHGSNAPQPQPVPQIPQQYYQQQPAQVEYCPEKGTVPGTTVPADTPQVGGTVGTTSPGMITLFGRQFTKKTVIITAIVIAVVLIFIIGLGAGLGAKAQKNKKSFHYGSGNNGQGGHTGCTGCDCYTDPVALQTCYNLAQNGRDNASGLIKRLHVI